MDTPAPGRRGPHAQDTSQHAPRPNTGQDEPDAPVTHDPRERAANLTAARLNVWSLVKLSFLIAVGAAATWVAVVAAVWVSLSASGAFAAAQGGIDTVLGGTGTLHLADYLALRQVVSVATAIGVAGVVLGTVLATVSGLAYNIVASLVGGLQLRLRQQG
jgi:uncharacterized membrane protein